MTDPSTPPPAEPVVSSPSGAGTVGPSVPTTFKVGIGSISDVVFGLALSIGSLMLVAKTPQTGSSLILGIYYFGFSFLIVILVWLSFRRIVVVLPYETPATLIVNVALLFCVAIEPFLFYVMVTVGPVGADASTAFAADLGAMMFLLSGLNYLLLEEERGQPTRKLSQEIMNRQAQSILLHLVVGSIYLISALPIFWTESILGGPIRYDLWYLAFVWVIAVQARLSSFPRSWPASGGPEARASLPVGGPAEAR